MSLIKDVILDNAIAYEKTDDPGIIRKIETNETIIRLDILQTEIEDLRLEINNIPKDKEKPDQETLDFWNDTRPVVDIELLELKLQGKEELLKKLKALK